MADLMAVSRAIQEAKQAGASVRARLFPTAAAFDAEVEQRAKARFDALPRHVKASKDEIVREVRLELHREYARESRAQLASVQTLRDKARQVLADTQAAVRRASRPVPVLTPEQKANPLASLLADTNQRLAAAELREEYAHTPASDLLRALTKARESGDALREYVLDTRLDAAIASATAGNAMQSLEHRQQLQRALHEIREQRVTASDRENLAAFAEQAAAVDREVNVLSQTVLAAEQAGHVLIDHPQPVGVAS